MVLAGGLVALLATLVALCVALFQSVLGRGQEQGGAIWKLLDGLFGDTLLVACLAVALAACLAVVAAAGVRGAKSGPAGRGHERSAAPGAISPDDPVTSVTPPPQAEPWVKLVGDCVDIVDELDTHMSGLDAPRREMAEHVLMRLEEVLARSGVEVISEEAVFDRSRHRPDDADGSAVPGAPIAETLSPGFAVGPRVLRRARVRVL